MLVFIDLILISMFLKYKAYELGIFDANRITKILRYQCRTKGEGWSTADPPPPPPPSNFIAGRLLFSLFDVLLGPCTRCSAASSKRLAYFSNSDAKVHVSRIFKRMYLTRERICYIFDRRV